MVYKTLCYHHSYDFCIHLYIVENGQKVGFYAFWQKYYICFNKNRGVSQNLLFAKMQFGDFRSDKLLVFVVIYPFWTDMEGVL